MSYGGKYQKLISLGQGMLDLLFPPFCLHCQRPLYHSAGLKLCSFCERSIPRLPERFVQVQILERLENGALDALWIPFGFNPVMRKLIHSVKYDHMPRLGERVGEWMAQQFLANNVFAISEPTMLIPIPLHPVRVKERGYNQSECLARGISRGLELSYSTDWLKRVRYTRSQTRLNREQRRENVMDAFTLSHADLESFRSVVLVDDLVTTGATMNECARTLRQAGVQHIIGMAVATPMNLGDAGLAV